MIRRLPTSVRRVLLAELMLLIAYAVTEAPFLYLERVNPAMVVGWRFMRPGRFVLMLFAGSLGFARVTAYHPTFEAGYGAWLALTPWTIRKQLPLGPVYPDWSDGVVLGTVILLSATQPEPRALQFLLVYLLSHLLILVPTAWEGRSAISYISAFGLGLFVREFRTPTTALMVAVPLYLLAYEGLYRSLSRLRWPSGPVRVLSRPDEEDVEEDLRQVLGCGWPYDRLLGEVRDERPMSRLDALIGCLLFSWWIDCLATLLPEPGPRGWILGVAGLIALAFPVLRVPAYTWGYGPPMSLGARLRTFRWIIPGYDRVFVGPICSLAAGPSTFALMSATGAPLEACLSVAYGMMILVALLTPPSLRRWRLTGHHRLLPRISEGDGTFIRVG